MKLLASMVLAAAIAMAAQVPAQAAERIDGPGEAQRFSSEVEDTPNGPAVRVAGKQYFLSGAIVYNPAGKRSSARLAPGTLVSFYLLGSGNDMRIKEVWAIK